MVAEPDALLKEALDALASADDPAALEQWRIAWIGTRGRMRTVMAQLRDVPAAERPAVGQRLNALRERIEQAFADRAGALAQEGTARAASSGRGRIASTIDPTEPGIPVGLGRRHVLSRTIDEIVEVFGRMGFSVAEGPEVEDEWHNFTALNIPPDHPARDATDNFYMGGSRLLRTQTSTVQIRTMERMPPPLRIIAVGRVYRPDTHDATHYSMFHQVEGLYVDRAVSMVDLKTVLFQFARAYFGPDAQVRIRPSFFPFTEPSAEVDMLMSIRGTPTWVELGGCGMVDPNVFRAVGIDPEAWTGFAFGLGIERIAMRRYGIPDIRLLFENDLRFLRQF
ncbi:MAG: phenylalanine--tRNA ligase subunit alpha [Phycisphaeraceae bacterium]|nr:phenylalanine--tRNA ligase subunit alpha [Phycisphaeraceae bacterium]